MGDDFDIDDALTCLSCLLCCVKMTVDSAKYTQNISTNRYDTGEINRNQTRNLSNQNNESYRNANSNGDTLSVRNVNLPEDQQPTSHITCNQGLHDVHAEPPKDPNEIQPPSYEEPPCYSEACNDEKSR